MKLGRAFKHPKDDSFIVDNIPVIVIDSSVSAL
jgi:hypothetical protein